jgi:hypothetical protein
MKQIFVLMGLLVLATGCATTQRRAGADDEFSQQVILVTVADGLDDAFIADTSKLGTIPGVVSLRIAKPVDFGPDHENPGWWIGDYDYAVFIEFESESVTDAYGAHAIHEAWSNKWGVKELPTFRALRAVGPVKPK